MTPRLQPTNTPFLSSSLQVKPSESWPPLAGSCFLPVLFLALLSALGLHHFAQMPQQGSVTNGLRVAMPLVRLPLVSASDTTELFPALDALSSLHRQLSWFLLLPGLIVCLLLPLPGQSAPGLRPGPLRFSIYILTLCDPAMLKTQQNLFRPPTPKFIPQTQSASPNSGLLYPAPQRLLSIV